MSFAIPIYSTQNGCDGQHSLTDAHGDAETHSPHPDVDVLGPDEHGREDDAALEALNERGAHGHAGEFVVAPTSGDGGAVEEDEIVDVEAGFEEGQCSPVYRGRERRGSCRGVRLGLLLLPAKTDGDGEQGVDNEIAQQVEEAAEVGRSVPAPGQRAVEAVEEAVEEPEREGEGLV